MFHRNQEQRPREESEGASRLPHLYQWIVMSQCISNHNTCLNGEVVLWQNAQSYVGHHTCTQRKISPSNSQSLPSSLLHCLPHPLSVPPSSLHFSLPSSPSLPSSFPPSPSPTCHNCIILDSPSHYHDGIVERSFRLFNELLRPSTKDQSTSPGLGATGENVVPVKVKGHTIIANRASATMLWSRAQ